MAQDVFDAPINPERLASYLASPEHHLMVALCDGEVVGQCGAVVIRHVDTRQELYIDNLGVTPAMQRRGIGRKLLDAMLAHGKTLGCREAWVLTGPDNLRARALYDTVASAHEQPAMYVIKL